MTSAEFSARYHLVKPVVNGPVRTLQALAAASGTTVMVHYLVGSAAENAAVLDQAARLPAGDRAKFVETVDVEGNTVIVTQLLPGFASLSSWMAGRGAQPQPASAASPGAVPLTAAMTQPLKAAAPAAPPAPPSSPPPRPAGEFTRLFGSAEASGGATPPTRPAQPAAAAPPPPPPPPAAPPPSPSRSPAPEQVVPGEFTRLFQSQSGGPPPPPAPAPLAMPSFAAPPAPAAPPEPVAPRTVRSGEAIGRATDVLAARIAQPVEPTPVVVPPVVLTPLPPAPLAPPSLPAAPPAANAASPLPFMMPLPAAAPIAPTAPPAPSAPAAPQLPTLPPPVLSSTGASQGGHVPSEFTRILGAQPQGASASLTPPGGAPAPVVPAPPAAPAQADGAKPSNLPIILLLNVVILAALALVLYFVFR